MAKTITDKHLAVLQAELRSGFPKNLELLAADLIGRLLKVRVSVSSSGFQHGGDAGTTGRAARHLRIECKRYSDASPLSERELKGEVDDALARNPSLEAWILVSTRNATETTQETLQLKSRSVGVPIIVIDWSKAAGSMPDLAALCAWAPDLVEAHHGKKAASAAKKLAALATPVVDRIRRELEPWNVGYKHLSRAAQQRLRRVWGNAGESRAALAQDAAGGASQALIERKQVQCLGP